MNLLEMISDQMALQSMPLIAVTVAAVPCPDTPVILTLHWHGFVEEKLADLDEAAAVAYTPIPSSALQVNHRWNALATLDGAAMEAGWELGAWDIARSERGGCLRPGARGGEAVECLQAFGGAAGGFNGKPVVVAAAPDADELVQLAARRGYFLWTFRPVHGGIWAGITDDATLRADGTREPPCPYNPVPASGTAFTRTVYRFGMAGSPARPN